jgi:hypothetical protein
MRRAAMLFKAFFTGIVDELPESILEAMLKKWQKLEGKDEYLEDVKQQSVSRRKSMFETATRSNYLLVVAAFVIAANVAMIVAPGGSTASQVLLKISTSMIALAAAVLTIAISAKSKVMKRPRKGGEVEPAEMLDAALQAEQSTTTDHDTVKWERVKRESNRLHKRKIILVVERRAQWIPAILMAAGLLVFIVGVCVR